MSDSAMEFPARYFHPDQREPGTRYLRVVVPVGSALSLGALVGVTVDVGWRPLWRSLEHADWTFALFVPLAVIVSHVGYAVAYRELARSQPGCRLSWGDALHIVVTGFAPLSPRGGYAIDTWELTRRGMSRGHAEARVRVLGMLEYAVLAPATLVAATYMAIQGIRAQSGLLPSWIIGVPAGSAVAVALLVRYRRAGRPESWWRPLRKNLDAIDGLLALLSSWRQAPWAVAGMVLYWAAEIAALGGCMDVFDHRRGSVAVMVVGYATGYALTRRSLPLAGAGVVEALMPFALSWVGLPLASSVLAVIAYRVFNLWLAMIPAVISLRRLERRDGPGRDRESTRGSAVAAGASPAVRIAS